MKSRYWPCAYFVQSTSEYWNVKVHQRL